MTGTFSCLQNKCFPFQTAWEATISATISCSKNILKDWGEELLRYRKRMKYINTCILRRSYSTTKNPNALCQEYITYQSPLQCFIQSTWHEDYSIMPVVLKLYTEKPLTAPSYQLSWAPPFWISYSLPGDDTSTTTWSLCTSLYPRNMWILVDQSRSIKVHHTGFRCG